MNKLDLQPYFKIADRLVGPGHPAFIIAEIGSNHDGSLERAKLMIKKCAEAGADAVKFQSFTADGLYVSRVKENGQWKEHPVWKILKNFELPLEWIGPLSAYAKECGVLFMSTPFEPGAVEEMERIGVPAYKIASGDLTHLELIRQAARTGKPVLIATGAGSLEEVRRAAEAVYAEGNRQAGLFHCVSLYPPYFEEMNLKAVSSLIQEFGCPTGLSDHTPGSEAVLAAVGLGAVLIEKHVTTDRSLSGPDHPYALLIEEFAAMVKAVRNLDGALGDGVKRAVDREIPEKTYARRGLYAAQAIGKGTVIRREMVKAVRPALGIPADQIDRLLGCVALENFEPEEPFVWSAVESYGKVEEPVR